MLWISCVFWNFLVILEARNGKKIQYITWCNCDWVKTDIRLCNAVLLPPFNHAQVFNSSPPSAFASVNGVITGSSKSLSPIRRQAITWVMLAYCQLDSWEHISVKLESDFYHFHWRKCIWKCHLPTFCPGRLVQGIKPQMHWFHSVHIWLISKKFLPWQYYGWRSIRCEVMPPSPCEFLYPKDIFTYNRAPG